MNMKNNQWIFVSIYYARGSWTNLLCEISALKKSLEHTFSYFCVLFSQEKGENIRLAISVSTKEDYDNVIEKLSKHINFYISSNISFRENEFEYGKVLWSNFENNSVVWDKFTLKTSSIIELEYIKRTSQVVLGLIDEDSSHDNFYSIAIYLFIYILKNLESTQRIENISRIIKTYSLKFSQFSDYDFITNDLSKQLQLNQGDILHIINSYWNESFSGNSEFNNWITFVINTINEHNLYMLIDNMFLVLGLNSVERIFIIEIMDKWIHENINNLST